MILRFVLLNLLIMFTFADLETQYGIYPDKDRIIVIGDLHADFKKTKDIFINLKLIDKNYNWIAEPLDTQVVQMGDQLDGSRGIKPEAYGELDLIDFMERINIKARKVGGAIHSIIGNHEVMNVLEDFRYASQKDIIEQVKYNSRREIFKAGGIVFGMLAGERHAIVKIGDLIFSHAGILPQTIDNNVNGNIFIIKVNKLMKLFLQGKIDINYPGVKKYFIYGDSILFNRDIGDVKLTQQDFDETLYKLDATHQFVGHTIQKKINGHYEDKLWRVDVGISEAFVNYNNIQVLEILNNEKNCNKQFNIINL